MKPLAGKTIFITGGSRGIGLAIGMRAAKDGANIVIAAKTSEPHPKLPGTIYTAAQEIEAAGGKALPLVVDVRNEEQVKDAVQKAVEVFGGIDICINNASAINLSSLEMTDMKRYDLMHQINTRGAFLVSKYCLPHLKKSSNAHILMISPPLDLKPQWFNGHVAYTISKYGMSLCVLGLAEELKPDGIAVNALWPRTTIATSAISNIVGSDEIMKASRTPDIMADAAYLIMIKSSMTFTGQFCIDDTLLYEHGVRDFDHYRVDPARNLTPDFFVPAESRPPVSLKAVQSKS